MSTYVTRILQTCTKFLPASGYSEPHPPLIPSRKQGQLPHAPADWSFRFYMNLASRDGMKQT